MSRLQGKLPKPLTCHSIGKEVYIIQSGSKRVNNDVFEMLTMVYACRTSSARKVVGMDQAGEGYIAHALL